MLHCLCFSFRCRFCSEMQGCAAMARMLFKWRPPAATYLCRFAAKARFDNRTNHRVGFPKGRGRNPSPFGRFKGIGFLRKGGNRNPPFLKWRSLVTFFRQEKKVTRRRHPAPQRGMSFAAERKEAAGGKKKVPRRRQNIKHKKKAPRRRHDKEPKSRPPGGFCHSTCSISLSPSTCTPWAFSTSAVTPSPGRSVPVNVPS